MKANRNPDKQNLFPIVQGGFDVQLRETSMQQVRCVCVCAVLCGCASAHPPACQHLGCSLFGKVLLLHTWCDVHTHTTYHAHASISRIPAPPSAPFLPAS